MALFRFAFPYVFPRCFYRSADVLDSISEKAVEVEEDILRKQLRRSHLLSIDFSMDTDGHVWRIAGTLREFVKLYIAGEQLPSYLQTPAGRGRFADRDDDDDDHEAEEEEEAHHELDDADD